MLKSLKDKISPTNISKKEIVFFIPDIGPSLLTKLYRHSITYKNYLQ